MRLMLEILSSNGFARSAAAGNFAFTASAPASGTSINRKSERAISAGLTETPGSNTGSTSGR